MKQHWYKEREVMLRVWPFQGRFMVDIDVPGTDYIDWAAFGNTEDEALEKAKLLVEALVAAGSLV
jgi:hypothetical protein